MASVDNALRLLLLLRDHQEIRLSDASRHLHVAHSTAHRLLAMLAYHDFVRQEPGQRTYVAGPALLEIGLAAVRKMDVRHHARPVLEELANTFGETSHVVRLEGSHVRYLDAVESARALRVTARTGMVLPASCTASGKVLLAQLRPEEVTALYGGDGTLPVATHRSITSLDDLVKELERIRRRGHAVNDQESEDGVVSVAVAVQSPGTPALCALTVSAPASRMRAPRINEIARELRQTAEALSQVIAGQQARRS
ncbi:MAG: helix-turn-helix domain-containing protein [Nitriliruptorales bacterium]|nr:helix-turn-helix domain-containing protein [Nitriliruptorales bacterium]